MKSGRILCFALLCTLLIGTPGEAQQKGVALKNATIVSMVKGGLPESVIVGAIQTSKTQFDVSGKGLAGLKKAGVSQKVIDAMLAAEARKKSGSPAAVGARGAVGRKAAVRQDPPYVLLIEEKAKQNISVERAQIAQAKSKNQDLNSLAVEELVAQALAASAAEAAAQAATRSGSAAGGALGQAASEAITGMFKRKPTVTYVWGLVGRTSSTSVPTNTPKFQVFYEGIPGVNASEFAPVLVKLIPAKNNWRLAGATKGKADALESGSPEWELYNSFVEEKVPTKLNKLPEGQLEIELAAPLPPGEYGLVLRPVAKNKKFAGSDLLNNQGEGSLFNSVWTFSVR